MDAMKTAAPTVCGARVLATLLGAPPAADEAPPAAETDRLTHLLRTGAYAEALAEPLARTLLPDDDAVSANTAERARAYLAQAAAKESAAEAILAVGGAALSLFAHANWTGAPVSRTLTSLALADARHDDALHALATDGEVAYALLETPRLLCAARALLVDMLDDLAPYQSIAAPWWASRCAVLHQRCLEEPSPTLERVATRGLRRALDALDALAGGHGDTAAASTTTDQEVAAEQVAAAGGTAEPSPSLRGKAVLVLGLEGRPELNGQRAVVGVFDETKGRYAVQFDAGGTPMLLKPDNLTLAGAGSAHSRSGAHQPEAVTPSASSAASVAGPVDTGWPAAWPDAVGGVWRDARALAHLESAHNHMLHRRNAAAANEIGFVKAALGVQLALTGLLGKRTKHQEKATSLLVLSVTRVADHAPPRGVPEAMAESAAGRNEGEAAGVPAIITEEDDQLLNEIALEGVDGVGELIPPSALRHLEQLCVLAECAHVQATRPVHESTMEEVEPYVRAALVLRRNWAAVTHALRLKARLESAQKRRRHQSLMQLEALVDDIRPPRTDDERTILARHLGQVDVADGVGDSSPHADVSDGAGVGTGPGVAALMSPSRLASRLRCFWGVGIGTRWQLGAELARTMAALGLLTEASALFKEYELWDEAVSAMAAMGHASAAADLVRAQLESNPTPSMHVHLGDISGDASCYETAWTLSKGSCARAKLKLGSLCMKDERWADAREHLQQALAVKAHYAEAWYCSSVCLLKLDDADAAMAEMRKVVALDPQHHQAWESLGGLFSKRRLKREALYAFREACKLRGDKWQYWQHAALAALDIGRFDEAIYAAQQSLALNGPPAPQISSLIAQAVGQDLADASDGRKTRRLLPKANTLLETACGMRPLDSVHWDSWLHLADKCGTRAEQCAVLRARLDAYQKHTSWKSEPEDLAAVEEVAAQLVVKMLESGEVADLKAAKTMVDKLLHAASDKLAATQGCEGLRMLMAKIQRHSDD